MLRFLTGLLRPAAFVFTFNLILSASASAQQILPLDVSGGNGRPPVDGPCCGILAPTTSHGQTPRPGDDAIIGSPGADAGSARIHLEDSTSTRGYVVVTGSLVYPSGARTSVDTRISLSGSIFVDASGGQGQRGGIGGTGQRGCTGSEGDDARAHHEADDGGPGCDSADSGDGTPGTDGGDGGSVRFYIPEDQTHLALLTAADVSRGSGGAGGVNGPRVPGGPGGPGGDGGRFETDQDCDYVDDSPSGGYGGGGGGGGGGGFSDMGNGYDTWNFNLPVQTIPGPWDIIKELFGPSPAYAGWECDPVYTRYSSGGQGPSGDDGNPGRGNVSPGRDGREGELEYVVYDPFTGEEQSYRRPFDLELVGYQVTDQNDGGNGDGIFEPGEFITIRDIRVRNREAMPSPARASALLTFKNRDWILIDPVETQIPTLAGHGEVTLGAVIRAQVKREFNVGENQSWSVESTIVPEGRITRVERSQGGLRLPKTISISYPIEIAPLNTVHSVGPGGEVRVRWRISNRSRRDFQGLNGMPREITLEVQRIGGDAGEEAIRNFAFAGNRDASGASFLTQLTTLQVGAPVIIEGAVQFSPAAEPYTTVELGTSLSIQALGTTSSEQISLLSQRITIAQTYTYTPSASLLLLTHAGVSREEFTQWRILADTLGLTTDVWDITYNQHLDLARDLDGQGESLLANYADKSIVLLNSSASASNGDTLTTLSRAQFFEAASQAGINFYVVGGDERVLRETISLMHKAPGRIPMTSEHLRELQGFMRAGELPTTDAAFDGFSGGTRALTELQNFVRSHPASGLSLVAESNAQGEATYRFVSTLSPLRGGMIALPAATAEMGTPGFISSAANVRSLLLSLGFGQKLTALMHLAESSDENTADYLRYAGAAVLHDLVEEEFLLLAQTPRNTATKYNQYAQTLTALDFNEVSALGAQILARVSAGYQAYQRMSEKPSPETLPNLNHAAYTSSFETWLEEFMAYAEKREDLLRADYDAKFDGYKMFTLPAVAHSLSGKSHYLLRPQIVRGAR